MPLPLLEDVEDRRPEADRRRLPDRDRDGFDLRDLLPLRELLLELLDPWDPRGGGGVGFGGMDGFLPGCGGDGERAGAESGEFVIRDRQ